MQRGDYGSGIETRALFICAPLLVHMLRWHSTPFRERYRSEKERNCSLLGEAGGLFSAVQLAALEQLQSIRSLAQALQTAQTTGPDKGLDPVTPVPGMGSSC